MLRRDTSTKKDSRVSAVKAINENERGRPRLKVAA